MNAVIIIIGDEILSGNTLDTNSYFITSRLKEIGISVRQIFTISDDVETIKQTLKQSFEIADIVISTGGIGPTKDDKTKQAYCEFFQDELVFDESVYHNIRNIFAERNKLELLELNQPQATVLSKAKVLQNDYGTAPCQMIEEKGKIAFILPGVPLEVKPLITQKIIPLIVDKFGFHHIVNQVISVVDFPESLLSEVIEQWELALPKNITLSYLPIGNRVKLRLTAIGENKAELEQQLEQQIQQLKPYISDKVISWNGNDIQEIIKDVLVEKQLTLSTAESCTGGKIAHLITSVSGSSAFFLGGIIPYETEKKTKILGVPEKLINDKTVVSAEVVQAMSLGCQQLFGSHIAVATTGVAGPNTDAFQSEIGTVFYSIRINDFEETKKLFLPHLERTDFIDFVSQRILQDVLVTLIKSNKR